MWLFYKWIVWCVATTNEFVSFVVYKLLTVKNSLFIRKKLVAQKSQFARLILRILKNCLNIKWNCSYQTCLYFLKKWMDDVCTFCSHFCRLKFVILRYNCYPRILYFIYLRIAYSREYKTYFNIYDIYICQVSRIFEKYFFLHINVHPLFHPLRERISKIIFLFFVLIVVVLPQLL